MYIGTKQKKSLTFLKSDYGYLNSFNNNIGLLINILNYTDMLTFRQFITNYCESNNIIPNNVPNDTFIDMTEKECNLSFAKRKDVVIFRCNKAKLKFIIVGNYLTYTLI